MNCAARLMPVNRKYSLEQLMDCCRKLPIPRRKRITFEYVLLRRRQRFGSECARSYAGCFRGMPSKVNVIPFNPHPGSEFQRPGDEARSSDFNKFFRDRACKSTCAGPAATILQAACGQLQGEAAMPLRGAHVAAEAISKPWQSTIIGVIGGSGLYQMEGLKSVREVAVTTPFGKPSDKFMRGKLGDAELVFLPRHGRGHRWLPTEINFRANIFAMKKLGVERIISVSAVGSLREEIAPGHLVVPDQFIDRTTPAAEHFLRQGIVAHVSLADPFCRSLSSVLVASGAEPKSATVHRGGTYLCMEGPQFSTRAESRLYRSLGRPCDRHDQSARSQAGARSGDLLRHAGAGHRLRLLEREAGDVEIEHVLAVLQKQCCDLAQRTIRRGGRRADAPARPAAVRQALKDAIITERRAIPKKLRRDLRPIIGKYL